jgi:tripartite-type tricarboxylate transporter receptor subunit TctC
MKWSIAYARALAAGLLLASAGLAAAQQAYPTKPIRLLIPFSPGGTSDVLGRLLAPKLSTALGQPVIVENWPGGNTIIASDVLLRAAPDGQTLLLAGNSHVLVPYLTKAPVQFDPIKDFAPVASLARTGLFLVVNPSLPANNLKEFIALAKSKPGGLNTASPGGSVNQLAMEIFNSLAGVKLRHIPYKGSGPAITDVVAGHADLSFQTPAAVLGFVKSGKLKALAVSGETPSQDPAVPTFTQAGLPGFDTGLSFGLLARVGTPKPVIDRVNAEVAKILAMPDFKEQVAAQGLEVFTSTPAQYGALMKHESEKFAKVIKAAGITPEQ